MELTYKPEKATKNTIRFAQKGWPVISQSFYVPKPVLEDNGVEIPEKGLPDVTLSVDVVIQAG